MTWCETCVMTWMETCVITLQNLRNDLITMQVYHSAFLPIFDALLLPIFTNMLAPTATSADRTAALCVFDDLIEHTAADGANAR